MGTAAVHLAEKGNAPRRRLCPRGFHHFVTSMRREHPSLCSWCGGQRRRGLGAGAARESRDGFGVLNGYGVGASEPAGWCNCLASLDFDAMRPQRALPSRSNRGSSDRTAIVVRSGSVTGLAAIRSLGRASIRALALDSDQQALGFYSRFGEPRRCPDPARDENAFVDGLIAIASELHHRVPVFPTDDKSLNVISRHQDILRQYLSFPFPPNILLRRIQDKRFQIDQARRIGIPYPRTCHNLSNDLDFPVVVKPGDPEPFRRKFLCQAFRCRDKEELEKAYEAALPFRPLVQEFIPGNDDELYTLGAFIDETGAALGLFCGRKLRQHPREIGTCRVGEAVWVDEVVESGVRYLQGLQYQGIAQVEFKFDARDRTYKLIEINPRLWRWHGLASACGVDLPVIAYRSLRGEPVIPVESRARTLRWVVSIQPGRRPAFTRPPVVDAVFARDDVRPFFWNLRNALFHGRVRRGLRRIVGT